MIRSGQKHTLLDRDAIASKTYVYSDWYSTKYDSIAAQVKMATLTASWVTMRIEGRYDSSSREASLYCERFTAVHNKDKVINIVADYPSIRIGCTSSPVSATPNLIYADLILFDVR